VSTISLTLFKIKSLSLQMTRSMGTSTTSAKNSFENNITLRC
jgi:hypothetical protein